METNEQMLARLYEIAEEQSGIVVGSYVKVLRAAKDNEYGWNNGWISPDMDALVGKVCRVIDKTNAGSRLEPVVPVEGYVPIFKFPFFVLEQVDYTPEPQFRPFDKVLVRDRDCQEWRPTFYIRFFGKSEYKHYTLAGTFIQCIPYEGNEDKIWTTNNPEGGNK